jgi:L-threonylcarbamoyladenylate synthase
MKVLKINPDDFEDNELQLAADVLNRGGVIAYPTETVYGLGANIFQRAAVARIFAIKGRDPHKPISIMISQAADVDEFCKDISAVGRTLMNAYWPGPLTLIFKASSKLPDYIVSREGKIGLRLPDHPICSALMRQHCAPVTSTSANPAGKPPLVNAQQIAEQFGEKIDLVIDGGACKTNVPSTVVDVSEGEPQVVRAGAIPPAEIQKLLLRTMYE